ncbi:Early nodulin-like protein 1 [Sesamum angolense]|uniref:Early nodulin-like protein 1 n=1 Tax=Sesamum angolense TaxID=2727404 RepID=A0AAE2BV06_9LAMI|nr:Early nodulin-like protein 1 [Sesamum angolense]
MASGAAASRAFSNLFVSAIFAASMVAGFRFEVGEERGWRKPTGEEPETYNEWASKNRFHIGDTVYFKYQKDSVLVVSSDDYLTCNTLNPISKFDDGGTVFQFDRSGLFYFISGQPGHCRLGQRLIIRVMHPSEVEAPELAPSPSSGGGWGGDGGLPADNSTAKRSGVSYFVTAPAGVLLILHLFMQEP